MKCSLARCGRTICYERRGIQTNGFESRKNVGTGRVLQARQVPQEALNMLVQAWEERFPLREIPDSLGELLEVLE